jgi:hypothetical protein
MELSKMPKIIWKIRDFKEVAINSNRSIKGNIKRKKHNYKHKK